MKGSQGKAKVVQLRMICSYTAGMGGVNLMDHLLSAYRPKLKGEMVVESVCECLEHCSEDAVCSASYNRTTESHPVSTRCCLWPTEGCAESKQLGSPTTPVPALLRYDGLNYFIESISYGP